MSNRAKSKFHEKPEFEVIPGQLFGQETIGKRTGKSVLKLVPGREPEINWENLSLEEITLLEEHLQKQISPDYTNIQFLDTKSARAHFVADWGPDKENPMKVIWKVDKKIFTSPRAKRHYLNGCDTENEIRVNSKIENPEDYNIIPIFDFRPAKDGFGAAYAEKFYPDYKPLYKSIREDGKFTRHEWESFMSKFLKTAIKYEEEGFLNRDYFSKNILVKRDAGEVQIKVHDSANATEIGKTVAADIPIAGSHMVLDPLLIGDINDEKKTYDVSSDIFEVGTVALEAKMGDYTWEFDPDFGNARVLNEHRKTGKLWDKYYSVKDKLLDIIEHMGYSALRENASLKKNGKLDGKKLNKLIKKTNKKANWKFHKYDSMLERMLTSNKDKRYSSFKEVLTDFERIKDSTPIMERMRSNVIGYSLVGGLAIGVGAIAPGMIDDFLTYMSKKEIDISWNGRGMQMRNSVFDGKIFAFSYQDFDNQYNSDLQPSSTLFLEPGGSLSLSLDANMTASSLEGFMKLNAVAYIPGYGKKVESYVRIDEFDQSVYHDSWWYGSLGRSGEGHISFDVPKDIPPGNYELIVEMSVPEDSELLNHYRLKPSQNMWRQPIPINIGGVPAFKINELSLNYPSNVNIDAINNSQMPKYLEVLIPELKNTEYDSQVSSSKYPDGNYGSFGIKLPTNLVNSNLTLNLNFYDSTGTRVGEYYYSIIAPEEEYGSFKFNNNPTPVQR